MARFRLRSTARWLLLLAFLLLLPSFALVARPVAAANIIPTGPTTVINAGGTLCALLPSRAVQCWGQGSVVGVFAGPYVAVAAGEFHACALTPTGAADCWGSGSGGAAEDQPGPYIQISAGWSHTCALTPTGAVDCWGSNGDGQAEDQPGPFTQISLGSHHTCALKTDGAVDCWGDNASGSSTDQPGPFGPWASPFLSLPEIITTGEHHSCGLTPRGEANCWGGDCGQASDTFGPFTEVSAGRFHTCGLKTTGEVNCWGLDDDGQAANMPGPYTEVSAGGWHTCALTLNRRVDCWGANDDGQTGSPSSYYYQISAGWKHTCGVTIELGIDCWGSDEYGQAEGQPPPASFQVSARSGHSCAWSYTGQVDCWGDNFNGRADDQPGPYGPYVPWALLTVKKVVVGDAPGDDWAFFSIALLGDLTLPAAGGEETFPLNPGATVTVSETDRPGWAATVACTGSETGIDSVTVTLPEAVATTCTFTNTLCQPGTYDDGTICKAADPGYYVPGFGATAQLPCPGGTTSGPGASACVPIGTLDEKVFIAYVSTP